MLRKQSEGGGRDAIASSATGEKNRQADRKFLDKKAGLKVGQFKIAHPDEEQWYVDQCGFVISWFREMFERVGSDDRKAAGEARFGLRNLLFSGVTKLTGLALDDSNSSAQWAREVLGDIDVWISKHRDRFGKDYEDLRRELSVVFRNDVWEPTSPLYQALHRELWLCQFYRREIPWPKAHRYLPKIQTNVVSAEYDSIMKLPPLSLKTLSKWEPKLWQLVRQNNPQLPSELQKRYKRVQARWSKYRKQFRQHLETMVKAAG